MFSSTMLKENESLFIPLNLENFRQGSKKSVDSMPRIIEPYVSALIGASGISRHQAKTCFYYAVATHLLPEQLELMPILAIIGALGTGKSKLMAQLVKMVKQPKLIGGGLRWLQYGMYLSEKVRF